MKKLTYLALYCALLTSTQIFAEATASNPSGHALEITIGGTGPAVDMNAYKKLRRLIGDAIADSTIDKFIILGYGKEGGFSSCVETRPTSEPPSKAFNQFVRKLKALKPNQTTTFYHVERVISCDSLAINKPATIWVAKADGSVQCKPNSGMSLKKMQEQLADITVYGAKKENDGLAHIAMCGAETGNYNVYEVAETDLAKALDAGFTEWQSIKPATVWVAKSDSSLQCEPDSGVSLETMQEQLMDITVYGAKKANDGQPHITLCGTDAGNYNVYEIAETDLSKALGFGFIEWQSTNTNP